MAKKRKVNSIGGAPVYLFPEPVIATRAPGSGDSNYELGQNWVNKSADTIYVLTSFSSGAPTWTTSPASGATTLSSLTVTTTCDIGTNCTVGGTLDVTGTTTVDDLVVGGSFNLSASTGQIDFTTSQAAADAIVLNATAGGVDITAGGSFDMDLTSAGGINIISNENAANAIFIEADGGISETIYIHADQGTGVASIQLDSDVGGITLTSGLASADAINIAAASGGVDIDGALQVNIASSQNAGDAVRINASAGGIDIDAAGAAGEDITIDNAAGSIVITAGESASDSLVLTSSTGGIDITATGASAGEDIDIVATGSSVNITSTENVASAIVLSATNGGIDVTAGSTEDIDITGSGGINITSTENAANSIFIESDGGISESITLHADQGTGVESINLESDVGGITLTAGLASDDAVNVESTGGFDLDAAMQINIASSEAQADAIVIDASDAAGGIDITSGGGDIDITSAGGLNLISNENGANAVTIEADGGMNETVFIHSDQGTAVTSINIQSDVGGITLDATGLASDDAINLSAGAGGVDIDGAMQINIASSEAQPDAIVINASDAGGGIDITTGGADLDLTSAAGVNIISNENGANAITIEADGGATETVFIHSDQGTAVTSINIQSDVGGITLDATGLASDDAINLAATAGGIDMDAAMQINIASSEAAADAIRINASDAAGGIDIDDGGGGIAIDSAAGISIDGGAASNFSTSAGDLTFDSAAGSVNITSGESAADSIVISSDAGGIDITAASASAGEDIDITATGSSVNITATEATADAIVLNASNAAGGIDLTTGGGSIDLSSAGAVSMVPGTATSASPTASATINTRVFKATFTGFTTASSATQAFTITNSAFGVGDGVMVTVSNAGSNDAKMRLERVDGETGGTLVVHTQNSGAAALNGSVVITGWILD